MTIHCWKNRKTIPSLVALLLLIGAVTAPAQSRTIDSKPYNVQISAGLLLPGILITDWVDSFIPKEVTFLVKAGADYYLFHDFSIGAYAAFSPLVFEYERDFTVDSTTYTMPETGTNMYEVGISGKYRHIMSEYVALKLGLGVGYRWTTDPNEDLLNSAGAALDGSLELEFFTPRLPVYWYTELGFLSQPYGGIQDISYISFNAIFYLTVGMGF